MNHGDSLKRLGRSVHHRRAMIRNLLTSLVTHEALQTTKVRCKVLKREVDKLITLGKKNSLHARRLAAQTLFTQEAVRKLFEELAPRYAGRQGGYCRIMLTGPRRGDGGEGAIIQLLPSDAPAAAEPTAVSGKSEETED